MGVLWRYTTPERGRTPAQHAIFGPPHSTARRLASAYAERGGARNPPPLQASAARLSNPEAPGLQVWARASSFVVAICVCVLHIRALLHVTRAALLRASWAGVGVSVRSAEARWLASGAPSLVRSPPRARSARWGAAAKRYIAVAPVAHQRVGPPSRTRGATYARRALPIIFNIALSINTLSTARVIPLSSGRM